MLWTPIRLVLLPPSRAHHHTRIVVGTKSSHPLLLRNNRISCPFLQWYPMNDHAAAQIRYMAMKRHGLKQGGSGSGSGSRGAGTRISAAPITATGRRHRRNPIVSRSSTVAVSESGPVAATATETAATSSATSSLSAHRMHFMHLNVTGHYVPGQPFQASTVPWPFGLKPIDYYSLQAQPPPSWPLPIHPPPRPGQQLIQKYLPGILITLFIAGTIYVSLYPDPHIYEYWRQVEQGNVPLDMDLHQQQQQQLVQDDDDENDEWDDNETEHDNHEGKT